MTRGGPLPEEADAFRERVLERVEWRGGFTGLRNHIVAEKRIAPQDWERGYHIFEGAKFNLAHNFMRGLDTNGDRAGTL